MASLDTIPQDLIIEIGSYLAFFDKVSLSLTSKTCRAKLGAFNCPDYTSWAAYLCINAHIYPPYQQIHLLPVGALDYPPTHDRFMHESSPRPQHWWVPRRMELLELKLGSFYSKNEECFKDFNVGGLRLKKPTRPSTLNEEAPRSNQPSASYKPDLLLRPYFPGLKYPENTLALFYVRHIKRVLGNDTQTEI